mgnify:FL=1
MTKFLIIRHGQSTANLEERYAGWYDAPLTELGRKQAAITTDYILKNYHVDAVYSSDLIRAVETVKEIAARANVPLVKEKALREIDGGEWERKQVEEIAREYPEQAYLWKTDIGKARPTGGESFAELQVRIDSALRKIAAENDGKTVVVASHGGAIRTMQCLFENVPIEDMRKVPWTPNASVSEVNYENGKYTPVRLGYTGHLGTLITEIPLMR